MLIIVGLVSVTDEIDKDAKLQMPLSLKQLNLSISMLYETCLEFYTTSEMCTTGATDVKITVQLVKYKIQKSSFCF